MAIIKCPDCKQKVSDKAGSCIHCGCPLPSSDVKEEETVITEKKSNEETVLPKGGINKTILIVGALVVLAIVGIVLSKGSGVSIPNVVEVDEQNASNIISSNSLIPKIEYEYDDDVEEGFVMATVPSYGTKVDKNSVVRVIVSKGPFRIFSNNSTINWYHIDYYKEDDWKFEAPYIEDGYLHISCNPTFAVPFSWKDEGFGTASINDTFDKKVPVKINYNHKDVNAYEEQEVELVISVNDLNVKKPTTLYTRLAIERNGKYSEISVNFTISWL